MKNPPHPGRHVLADCLEPLDLSITKGAEILGVTRLTLSNVVNGKRRKMGSESWTALDCAPKEEMGSE